MKELTKHLTRIDSDSPWHALIDIFPDSARGAGDVRLIGDPIYYGPEELAKVVNITQRLMRIVTSGNRDLYQRMNAELTIEATSEPGKIAGSSRRELEPDSSWRKSLRQRILVSVAVRSGEVETELAYSNADPAAYSPEDIDWLVSELGQRLQNWFHPRGSYIAGQN